MRRGPIDDAIGYFSHNAREFDELYRLQPGFYEERLAIWRALLDKYATPGGTLVDLGSGSGILTFYLAERMSRAIGVDGAPDMVAYAEAQREERGLSNVSFMLAQLPVVDETLLRNADLVISSSVVEYIDDLDATLRLFARLVRPNGIVIVSMPNLVSISRTYQRIRYRLTGEPQVYRYIRHFSAPRRLGRRVRPLGLTLVESHYYTHTTRLAQLCRSLRLPQHLTEDLFVSVFRKS
jgi:2-polyprenyl-3-methyl-5-hydroxy-6-metoxy-1,4-benzoquinol methylase